MLHLASSPPKTMKTGKNSMKAGGTPLLLSSIEFTAVLHAAGRGGPVARALPVPGRGWCLVVAHGSAALGAKRGGQRIFKTLDALVNTASKIGCETVLFEVPKARTRTIETN